MLQLPDLTQLPDVTQLPVGYDKNVLLVVGTMVAGIVTSLITLWKGSRDQKHSVDMFKLQHEADMADRAEKFYEARQDRVAQAATERAERDEKARTLEYAVAREADSVRNRLESHHSSAQVRLEATNDRIRDRVEASADKVRTKLDEQVECATEKAAKALNEQTASLTAVIEGAKVFTADKADAAYNEANSVNVKLEKLHQAHAAQGEVLKRLLLVVEQSASGVTSAAVADALKERS